VHSASCIHTDKPQRVEADGQLLRGSAKRTNTTQAANSKPQRRPQGNKPDNGLLFSRWANIHDRGWRVLFFLTAPHWCGNRSRHEHHQQGGQTQGHEVIGSEFGNGPLNIIKG
jgi:hypothetical protein